MSSIIVVELDIEHVGISHVIHPNYIHCGNFDTPMTVSTAPGSILLRLTKRQLDDLEKEIAYIKTTLP